MGQQFSDIVFSRAQLSKHQRRLLWLSSIVFASTLSLPVSWQSGDVVRRGRAVG